MTRFPDGVGGGAETVRSYVAEEFPSGAPRSVARWLKTLVGRDDIVRVWLKPVGSRDTIWEHTGRLDEVPDLDAFLAEGVDADASAA